MLRTFVTLALIFLEGRRRDAPAHRNDVAIEAAARKPDNEPLN